MGKVRETESEADYSTTVIVIVRLSRPRLPENLDVIRLITRMQECGTEIPSTRTH